MRRFRRAACAAVVVALAAVPGAASGQTTTTTSASTTTTTVASTTTTTVAATTTTTVANPCAGRPCTTEAPGAVLSTASAQIQADHGTYCWLQPTGGTTMCAAVTRPEDYKPPLLVVTQGEVVTVRFTAAVALVPEQVALVVGAQRSTLAATNPTQFRVDLAPGVHESVSLATRWLQGEVPYGFRLDVRAAPTTPRLLALTG